MSGGGHHRRFHSSVRRSTASCRRPSHRAATRAHSSPHFVGSGLDDDRYVVEKFRSLANGDIVPVDQPARKGRRKARRIIVSLKAVEKMRPARDKIIIATGVKLRECGVQLWGWRATGIFADRRQRG